MVQYTVLLVNLMMQPPCASGAPWLGQDSSQCQEVQFFHWGRKEKKVKGQDSSAREWDGMGQGDVEVYSMCVWSWSVISDEFCVILELLCVINYEVMLRVFLISESRIMSHVVVLKFFLILELHIVSHVIILEFLSHV